MTYQISYEEAVQKIDDRIADHKKANSSVFFQDSTDDESVLRNILTLKGQWHLVHDRSTLFAKSAIDRTFYDMLRYALAEKVHLSLSLEVDEAVWVARALAGDHSVPSYASRAYTAHEGVRKFGLHSLVVNCVHILRMRGLKHRLACDAVAEAFGKHNLDIQSASTVADIWKANMPQQYRTKSEK